MFARPFGEVVLSTLMELNGHGADFSNQCGTA